MRFLLVDDDVDNIEALALLIQSVDADAEILTARDREAASRLLAPPNLYDFMILDLRLPPSADTAESADVSQGLAVLEIARAVAPGSIIRVLTGYPQMDMASEYQGRYPVATVIDIPALRFISKENMLSLREIVGDVKQMLLSLDTTELNCRGRQLTVAERRLIAFHAKKISAVKANVFVLGGASGASTFKVEFYDDGGTPTGRVVAKIDSLDSIDKELSNYQLLVAPFLSVGAIAAIAGEKIVYYDKAAIFFRLANEYPYDFYEYCARDAEKAADLVETLQKLTTGWVENTVVNEVSVRDVVSTYVDDLDGLLATLDAPEVDRIKSKLTTRFRSRVAKQHSDMHGQNILVSSDGDPILIDFQHVGKFQPPIDPVTLELSLVFHPGSSGLRGDWPSTFACAKWADVDAFCVDSKLQPVVKACRAWAELLVAPVSVKTIAATALAYCLWQMKFETTNKATALSIAIAAADQL